MSQANTYGQSTDPTYNQGAGAGYGKGEVREQGMGMGTGQNPLSSEGHRQPMGQKGQLHEYGARDQGYGGDRTDMQGGAVDDRQGLSGAGRTGYTGPGDREFGDQPGVGGTGQPHTRMDEGAAGDNVRSYDESNFGKQTGAEQPGFGTAGREPAYKDAEFGRQPGVGTTQDQGHRPAPGYGSGVTDSTHTGTHGARADTHTDRGREHGYGDRNTADDITDRGMGSEPAATEREAKKLDRSAKVDKVIGTVLGSTAKKEKAMDKKEEAAELRERAREERGDRDAGHCDTAGKGRRDDRSPTRNTHGATGARSGGGDYGKQY